jgi:DNA-binding MarR family transcriptional regulator
VISVTPEGHALLEELRSRKDVFLAHRLEALSPAERETLGDAAAILERLLEQEPS